MKSPDCCWAANGDSRRVQASRIRNKMEGACVFSGREALIVGTLLMFLNEGEDEPAGKAGTT